MSISIYYATVTGNSEEAANSIKDKLTAAGKEAVVSPISELSVADLKNTTKAIFVSSTFGDGEPPMDAEGFYNELKDSSDDLSNLEYAVFGLGESFYDQFCQTAIDFDQFLADRGAKRLIDVEKADGDADSYIEDWMPKAIAAF